MQSKEKDNFKKATDDILKDVRINPSLTKNDLKSKYGKYYTDSIDDYIHSLKDLSHEEKIGKLQVDEYNRALRAQNQIQIDTRSTTERITDGLKGFGKTALSIIGNTGINLAVNAAFGLLAKGIDSAVHYQDNLIKKGQEAKDSILDQSKAYIDQKSSLEQLTARYGELSKGITISGNRIRNTGLSSDEYKEFLEISNQIAATAPSISKTFDEQGNAVFSAGTNVHQLNSQVAEYIKLQRDLTHYNVKQKIDEQYKGVSEEIKNANTDKLYATDRLKHFEDTQKQINDFYSSLAKAQKEGNMQSFDLSADLANDLQSRLSKIGVSTTPSILNPETNTISFSIDTSGMNTDKLKEVQQIVTDINTDISKAQNETRATLQESTNITAQKWNELLPSMQTLVQTTDAFDKWTDKDLAEKVRNNVSSMIMNLDYSGTAKYLKNYGDNLYDFTEKGIIDPIAKAGADQQKAWEKLFDFDPNSKEYGSIPKIV